MAENQIKKNIFNKKVLIILGAIGVVGLVLGIIYYRYSKTHISTDDAYVAGNIYSLSFRVPGSVSQVLVNDNQLVEKGQLIATLDSTDYEVAVKEAQANLDAIKSRWLSSRLAVPLEKNQTLARINESTAGKGVMEKNLLQAQDQVKRAEQQTQSLKAILDKAARDRTRYTNLYNKKAISQQQYEEAQTQYTVAEANYKASLAAQEALEKNLGALRDQINRAEAQVHLAQTGHQSVKIREQAAKSAQSELDLATARLEQARLRKSYTELRAPAHGHITKKNIEVGDQVQSGQPLMALVPLDNLWVVANYKETDLTRIRKGDRVTLKADTYPDITIRGRVDSIMAGTGSAFSLFPPENATGNYVKVVQRIPVKIILDPNQKDLPRLRVGMSVIPTILVKDHPDNTAVPQG